MRLDQLVENRILEAIEGGAFDDLAGAGAPLPRRDRDRLAGNLWMAHRILGNAGLLPEWLELAREIERGEEQLAATERAHRTLVDGVITSGDWRRSAPLIAARRREFAQAGHGLRAKQDRYNLDAPAILCERPGIWIEERLRRLDERLRATLHRVRDQEMAEELRVTVHG